MIPSGDAQQRASRRLGRRGAPMAAIAAVAALPLLAAAGCEASRAPAKSTPAVESTSNAAQSATAATASAPQAEQPAAAPVVDTAVRNITFDKIKFDLKANADYKPEMLTPEIKALDGRNVRIRGFMFPSFKPTGLTEWVLVRDNLQCCFGGNAILYDCIIVDMKPGKSTDYTTRPVAVEGTFTVRDWFDTDGVRRAIYHLDGESVRF